MGETQGLYPALGQESLLCRTQLSPTAPSFPHHGQPPYNIDPMDIPAWLRKRGWCLVNLAMGVLVVLLTVALVVVVLRSSERHDAPPPTTTSTVPTSTSTTTTSTVPTTTCSPVACTTCHDLLTQGQTTDGVYTLQLWNQAFCAHRQVTAFCDMTGGGYTVAHQMMDGSVNGWSEEYASGLDGRSWWGLDILHLLSTNCGHNNTHFTFTCRHRPGRIANLLPKLGLRNNHWFRYALCYALAAESPCRYCSLERYCENELDPDCADVWIQRSVIDLRNDSLTLLLHAGNRMPFTGWLAINLFDNADREMLTESIPSLERGRNYTISMEGFMPASWYRVRTCLHFQVPDSLRRSVLMTGSQVKCLEDESYKTLSTATSGTATLIGNVILVLWCTLVGVIFV